jgi:hypothetical protein
MLELSFKDNAVLESESGDQEIPKDHIIGIVLNDIVIDTSNFDSRDKLILDRKEREGIVRIKVSGQDTVIPYSGKGLVAQKYRDKILYFGVNPGDLSIQCQLIETDEEIRKVLGNANKIGSKLASSPLAKLNPAVGPGIGFLGAVLSYIKTQVDDDDESISYIINEQPLSDSGKLTIKAGNKDKIKIAVEMQVFDFGAPNEFKGLSVRINDPIIKFNDTQIYSGHTPYTPQYFITDCKKMSLFNFQASSGQNNVALSTDLKKIDSSLAWGKHELFKVPAAKAAKDRSIMPMAVNFSLNQKDLNAEGLLEIAAKGLGFVEALGADVAKTSKLLEKQGQSALSLISEMTDNNLSLFSFDGLLVLQPDGTDFKHEVNGYKMLPWDKDKNVWSHRFKKDITWEDKTLGDITFEIEIKPL